MLTAAAPLVHDKQFTSHASKPEPRLLAPLNPPDDLSHAVIASLCRRMHPKVAWAAIQTLVLGLLSGGLLPLLLLPRAFQNFVNAERNQLWHFAEWLRLRYPSSETEKFQQAVGKLKFRKSLWIGAAALALLAIVWAWSDLSKAADQPLTPAFLFTFTARLPHFVREFAAVPRVMIAAEGFSMLLVAAHLLLVGQVVAHLADVRKAMELFNLAAKKHDLPTIDLPKLSWRWSGVWIVCALAAAAIGALWGVPMMLAAAAQARYINGSGRAMRLALAARTFNVLSRQRPMLDLIIPAALRGLCTNVHCAAQIAPGAGFCQRCGQRIEARPDLSFA